MRISGPTCGSGGPGSALLERCAKWATTRSGVRGSSATNASAPWRRSASSTAAAIAAGTGIVPLSPTPKTFYLNFANATTPPTVGKFSVLVIYART